MKLIIDKVKSGQRGYKYLLKCPTCSKEFWKNEYVVKHNKNVFCSMKCYIPVLREQRRGTNNYAWKGKDVSYAGLHYWVRRELGDATICSECGSTEKMGWANISKKYKRDLLDWKQLCQVCHWAFDGITKLTKEQAESIKRAIYNGVRQRALAVKYDVHQVTISNIYRGKIKYYG